jgi:hypothetical protein
MNLMRPFSDVVVEMATLSPWFKLNAFLREKLVLLATFTLLTLMLLLWALFIRRRGPRRSRYKLHSTAASSRSRNAEGSGPTERPRKWRRRRRRDHRPRNPTLAETGGLPPLRTQGPSETTF